MEARRQQRKDRETFIVACLRAKMIQIGAKKKFTTARWRPMSFRCGFRQRTSEAGDKEPA